MIESPPNAWRVFAQGDEPRLALAAWRRNAERFFGFHFDVEESSGPAARLVSSGARRVVVGRTREEADLRDALADEGARNNGLYDLAERRCNVVWLVEREGPDDRVALLLAATIATVALGPILGNESSSGEATRWELFGVRTARDKLDSLGVPYR